MKINLNGEWLFKSTLNNEYLKGNVPGCNYLDLIDNKVISDPFYGVNEKDCYWVATKDWEYKRSFSIDNNTLSFDRVYLVCKMLDTITTITINGNMVAKTNNCHIDYMFDVKEYLHEGDNEISIVFSSPVNYVNKKQAMEKCPNNANGLNGIPHIRKPQCHFGWDWGPVLTPSGIQGDIFLSCHNIARVSEVKLKQKHSENHVELSYNVTIDNYTEKSINAEVVLTSPNGEVITKNELVTGNYGGIIDIENPILWSIKELNGLDIQPLYTITINLYDDNNLVDSLTKRIGLRTIVLEQKPDKYGMNFVFVLNGTKIFAKGANWIPADSFITRADRKTIEFYIKSARDSHFNMLRVWGGGYYESEDFYDLCDEYGILVWQDFTFACQPYPFFMKDFLENVKNEVACVVRRIRDHASLALWCGNNEIELMAIAWKFRRNYVEWTEKFFWDILPKYLPTFDDVTSYIPGTPIGLEHDSGFSNDNVGDTHLWAVWHGLQPMTYYRKRMTRFCSEFGFESLPDIKTVKTFAEEKDYSLTSPVFLSHQKCASGNMKMAFYIASRFSLPKKFEDYIYLSQICEQECIRDATEHWRRNKGRCNGSLFWQYNDCWPVCSWSSVDYYGNYKALQYTSKHFFAPLMLSFEDTKKKVDLYIINDRLEEYDILAKLKLVDYNGKVVWNCDVQSHVQKNESKRIQSISISDLNRIRKVKDCVLVAELYANGKYISRKTLLFDKEKNLKLPKANISVSVRVEDNKAIYTLNSKTFARLVSINAKNNTNPFSDNFFDILPGESVDITQELKDNQNVDNLLKDITITTVTDIEPKSSRFSDNLFRVKVFLTPINFFNWVYYNMIPKKVKVDYDPSQDK